MSRIPERLWRFGARVVATFIVLASLVVVTPAAAQISIKSSFVAPIVPGGVCTAEARDTLPQNAAFDGRPYGNPAGSGLPALEDAVEPSNINAQAGARTDFCVSYALTPDMNYPYRDGYTATPDQLRATHLRYGDDQKRIVVETPVGFAAAITAASVCGEGRAIPGNFTSDGFGLGDTRDARCPADARVGTGDIRVLTTTQPASPQEYYDGNPFMVFADNQAIVRLPAQGDELARLGLSIKVPSVGVTKFVIRVKFADGDPLRLVSIVDPAPRDLYNNAGARFAIYAETVALRLWGSNTTHPTMLGSFAENGTRCGTNLSSSIRLTTYGEYGTIFATDPPYTLENPAHVDFTDPARYRAPRDPVVIDEQTTPYALVGCESLAFEPSVSIETEAKAPAVPTGVKVTLGLGQTDPSAATGTALLKDAAVTLPAGLELGAQVGARSGGLALCTPAQFGRAAATPAVCPPASKVGTVKIVSPLIGEPLSGSVFLGPQRAVGELPDLYLEASLGGRTVADTPRVKLAGETVVSADGQITSTFNDNPELRFSQLELEFEGGPNALFITPRACGTYTSTSKLASWAKPGQTVSVGSSIAINEDCALPAFAPSVAVTPSNTQAGVKAPFSVAISRPDRAPWLKDVHVSLPTGQLADLKVVPECSRAAAAQGACPAESRIASVRSVAGAGSSPLALDGAMYLVEHTPGSVAGALIVVRAKIGELDLGDVVVPGTINLRPFDAGLDFITTAPTRFRGLALNLQSIVVNMDRHDFALNPSSCGPLGYSATITDDAGGSALAGGQVAYTGCEAMPFGAELIASLTGDVRPLGHPGMNVRLNTFPGATMRSANVVLPDGVAADLRNVQVSCVREDFDAARCPENTNVGTVAARVAITHELITGGVYLVKVPGETLPGIGLNFTGRFAQRLASTVKINREGRLVVNFAQIPDLPLREFTIDVRGGEKGPLMLPPGSCATNTRWDGTFTAWSGQTTTSEFGLRCAATSKVRLTPRAGLTVRNFDFGGRNLRYVKATLPSGMSFVSKRAKSKKYTWARTKGSKSNRLRIAKRSITVTPHSADATDVRIKVKGDAIKASKRASKRKSFKVKLRFVFTDGAVQTQEVTYKVPQKKSKRRAKR